MSPHSLFELPILPLQNMCNMVPLFCHFSINAPIWNQPSINIKMKRPCTTSKSLPQSLTGCHFISDSENKSNNKSGLEEESPTGGTLWKCTSLTQSVREEEEAVGGVGGSREVTMIFPDPDVRQDGSGARPLKNSTDAGCVRPTVGEGPPQRIP